MERMWRKVNHSLRNSKSQAPGQQHPQQQGGDALAGSAGTAATPLSTDTISSAGGFGDAQLVVAVQGIAAGGSNATGRRLASSGQASSCQKSLSQHVLQTRTASSERRRRRRRKSRPRRSGVVGGVTSCVGDAGGDNMSSSGGFYTLKEHQHQHHRHGGRSSQSVSSSMRRLFATSAPSGTVMMYPNAQRGPTLGASNALAAAAPPAVHATPTAVATAQPDISLRQRAVAKLRMFNFHLNWDLHMTHCKPCGPRLSGSGNIITRRLCRNRRREDNELYRSNSFKFERFERKECLEELSNTLQKQIAICDDYSLPVDFVKKRPSSFDPCLAEAIPTNPEHWIVPSPQTEFLPFAEAQQQSSQQQQQQQQQQATIQLLPAAAPLATLPSQLHGGQTAASIVGSHHSNLAHNNNTLPALPQQQQQQLQQKQQQQPQQKQQPQLQQRATLQHPPLPNSNIKQASVKLIEGYSDPKDTRQHKKVYHKKAKRRAATSQKRQQPLPQQLKQLQPRRQAQQQQQQQQQQPQQEQQQLQQNNNNSNGKPQRRSQYNSDSSPPKSSDDEADIDEDAEPAASLPTPAPPPPPPPPPLPPAAAAATLNSPDSITDDLVRPLPPQLQRSPRKLLVSHLEHSKRQPSPYYYSDLLKSKDKHAQPGGSSSNAALERESKQKCRQSTASEPPQQTQPALLAGGYRKSSSLDAPQVQEHNGGDDEDNNDVGEADVCNDCNDCEACEADNDNDNDKEEEEEQQQQQSAVAAGALDQDAPKRYSFTEDGVHIIRCDTPSSTTSEESDCSECLKRREWHARALALVRKTCNVQPRLKNSASVASGALELQLQHCDAGEGELLKCCPLPTPTPPPPPPPASNCEADATPMPPHRLLGPAAVCACVNAGEEIEEYFRPRSTFYVHAHGVHECAECAPQSQPAAAIAALSSKSHRLDPAQGDDDADADADEEAEEDDDDEEDDEEEDGEEGDIMSGRRRQLYETAFDCKIAKSDDDLDEVDRITNHSVLLQLSHSNGNSNSNSNSNGNGNGLGNGLPKQSHKAHHKSRLECKRLKNCKNQALQELCTTTDSGAAATLVVVEAELNQLQLVDQQNNATQPAPGSAASTLASTAVVGPAAAANTAAAGVAPAAASSQLPLRGYTPSPPSTAPLPMKFPDKHEREHDRHYMNSIKSAPNLPAANPLHSRLRELRLPLQPMLRQPQQSSNDTSLTDSAYVNPPSTNSNSLATTTPAPAPGAGRPRSNRPRSFVLESGRVLELRRSAGAAAAAATGQHHQHHHHHHVSGAHGPGRGAHGQSRRRHAHGHNYSSTESIATSSSGGSMESLRSSTSEGNRSTSSSESRHSSSLSSHSSESGSSSVAYPLRAPLVLHSKLHILSPISDKSAQEPASELSQAPPSGEQPNGGSVTLAGPPLTTAPASQKQRCQRAPPNKALLHLADELLGSDSGISLHSREEGKQPALGLQRLTLPKLQLAAADKHAEGEAGAAALPQDLRDLPFDMPKLRRRKTLQQEAACTSGSATSVDLGELPFDMPKLRRRLRANQAEISNLLMHSTESSGISQASSSHSMRDEQKLASKLDTALFRQNLTLNLNEPRQVNKFGSLDLRGLSQHSKELNVKLGQSYVTAVDLIDISIPLERQGWYHGAITRIEAETTLRPLAEGSFLVRNCESTKQDYSLSLKGAKGFMHMRIQRNETGQYILGQFSRPFETVPEMIRHFCLNRLPVRGAEHMCLIEPVIAQLL